MPLDYPGHLLTPETSLEYDMTGMVEALVDHIDTSDRYALLGASLGGFVAFELARRLSATRNGPAAVVTVCTAAPHRVPVQSPLAELEEKALIMEFGKRYGGLDDGVMSDDVLRSLLAPVVRADMSVYESYVRSGPPALKLPVIAIGGTDDFIAPPSSVCAWRSYSADCSPVIIEGAEHFMLDTHAQALADVLDRELDRYFD